MARQVWHRLLFVGIALVSVLLAGGARAEGPRPASVLVLLSDDQRADTIQALGNPHLRTPAVDALVARGTVCDRAYCMGSMGGAVCVPSRAMMLSGRSLFRIDEHLRGCDTWPEAFARAGYRTFLTGKWHNGAASATRCFAEGSNVFLGGMHDQFSVPPRNTLLPSAKHRVADAPPLCHLPVRKVR